jgi:C4-dicarboxylate transporter, DctM subunit
MVLYAVVADASIGQLFIAGVLPGLMMATLFAAFCMARSSAGGACRIKRPGRAPARWLARALTGRSGR